MFCQSKDIIGIYRYRNVSTVDYENDKKDRLRSDILEYDEVGVLSNKNRHWYLPLPQNIKY